MSEKREIGCSFVEIRDGRGVLKEILREGTGEDKPFDGCKVFCHYAAILGGTKISSRMNIGDLSPVFVLGAVSGSNVIYQCVASMKKGEKSRYVMSTPEFIDVGSPSAIPECLKVVFELELVSWEPQDLSSNKDGSIGRQMLTKKSKTCKSPEPGAIIQAHIIGKYEDVVFDERDVEIKLFDKNDIEVVIYGIHLALLYFSLNETSRLTIQSQHAFGVTGHEKFNIPPSATVEYTVTLNSFVNINETRIQAEANKSKLSGNDFYKHEEYASALRAYNNSILLLVNCSNAESQQIKVAVHLNIALCHQKVDDHLNARIACNKALKIEPNNIKALYRRGTSCLKAGETDAALLDFQMVNKLDPTAAISQIAACYKLIRENEKKLYANMFKSTAVDIENKKIVPKKRSEVLP